jgi:effector-binding domain-containing protein
MNLPFSLRAGMIALMAAVAIGLVSGGASAQAPSASPAPAASASPAPAVSASPTPAPSASPTPAATPSPATPAAATPSASPSPSAEQTPSPAPSAQTSAPFGEQITLEPKKVLIVKGTANWDSAYDALIDSFKSLTALLDKQGIKPTGNLMIVYTSTDDPGFTYLAEIPVNQEPKNLGKNMSMGQSPEGKALKFIHRGSYDNLEDTYEAITNHIEEKKVETKDTFIEEYITDPLKTSEDKFVINIYVPLK